MAGHLLATRRQLRVQGRAQRCVGRELWAPCRRRRGEHPLDPPSAGNVKFYYDHKSHWITDNKSSVIAVAPGSFQSELGCPADWDPGCLRSWLQDPDGDGIYTF